MLRLSDMRHIVSISILQGGWAKRELSNIIDFFYNGSSQSHYSPWNNNSAYHTSLSHNARGHGFRLQLNGRSAMICQGPLWFWGTIFYLVPNSVHPLSLDWGLHLGRQEPYRTRYWDWKPKSRTSRSKHGREDQEPTVRVVAMSSQRHGSVA